MCSESARLISGSTVGCWSVHISAYRIGPICRTLPTPNPARHFRPAMPTAESTAAAGATDKPFPSKEQRKLCWDARDAYWQCLDKNAPEHQATSGAKEPAVCLQMRKLFQSQCPGQWVKHFDRKRTYEQFKQKMEKGYDPLKQ